MPLEDKKYDVEANNDWAKTVKGEHLFINNAESGRKGYYCIGCDKQMEAVKKKNVNHRSYFRHIPVDVAKDETPCTFSNREYRELLATDILQRLKTIKVPNVYKYPSKKEEGAPMLLDKARVITAHKVKSQITFYEDSDGAVKYGKNPDIEDRYLLIRPDVVFFNIDNEPILFIELVITHKVNEEKKIKLRRLGIDTVSVIVPKSSEQDIEDNFRSTKRIKWEYNGNEANTKYVPVSFGTSEGVLEFDADQRRIFEESLACRKARLSNTLRTIRKCLGAEPYRRAQRDFESEISRIEKATDSERQRLEEMEGRIDKEVREQFRDRAFNIESQRGDLNVREEGFREEFNDLENRYQSKKEELRTNQRRVNSDKEAELENGGTEESIRGRFGRASQELREGFDREEESLIRIIERRIETNNQLSGESEELSEEFRQLEKQERESFNIRKTEAREQNREWYRINEEGISENIGREKRSIGDVQYKEQTLREEFEQLEKQEEESFREEKAILDSEEKGLEESIREELIRELKEPTSELPKRIKFILEAQRVGRDFETASSEEQYYRRAREFFNKGTWKTW